MSRGEKLTDDEVRDRFLSSMDDAARWQFISTVTDRGLLQKVVSLVSNYCDEELDAKVDALMKQYGKKK